jgi:hypothetical protein
VVQKLPKSMGRRFGSLAYETGRIRLCRVARSRMPHGLRSVKATTFRKESRIADMGLVILCKFGLSLRAGDGRKAINGGSWPWLFIAMSTLPYGIRVIPIRS